MTFSFGPGDINDAIEIASIVGTIVSVLLFVVVAYFLVRPKRDQDAPRRPEPDRIEMEQMLGLMDRMERRLAVLEREMTEQERTRRVAAPQDRELLTAVEDREPGRME